MWCGVNGIIAGFHEIERAGEGVAVLLNDMSRVKVCEVVEFGLTDGDGEERKRFWNDLDKVVGVLVEKKRVVDFCAVRGLCVCNTNVEQKSLLKYNRGIRGQGR